MDTRGVIEGGALDYARKPLLRFVCRAWRLLPRFAPAARRPEGGNMGKRFVIVWAAIAAMSPTASAQTRTFGGEITAGSISGFLNGREIAAQFDLAGPGFHITGFTGEPGRLVGMNICRLESICRPGDEVSLSSFFINSVGGFLLGNGRVTVNGETLQPALVSMELFTLTADPATIPRGHRKNLVLSSPFVLLKGFPPQQGMAIQVRVFGYDQSITDEPWAAGEISGQGIVVGSYERLSFESTPGRGGPKIFHYVLRNILYSFNTD